ncbi:phosphatase PAP2 family protein [Streptomyces sp. NPDC049585]|uniref:phosphatase PAP2 family protein n=1 Tax=Streptomyces sp. NPDC049585 TaxID=3155154 RepID=UPI003443BD17
MFLVLLVVTTWQVAAHGPLRALDERLGRAAYAPSGAARFFADLGNASVAVPVLAVAVGFALWRRQWRTAAAAALALAAVPAVVVPFKALVGRVGPPAMAGAPHEFFPSGHAATAAVAYGAAALLLCRRRVWLWAVALLNVAVGFGLVRCGYHWPLDVVGAWALSGALLMCVARVRAGGWFVPTRPSPG